MSPLYFAKLLHLLPISLQFTLFSSYTGFLLPPRCDLLVPWSRTSLFQNRAFAVVGPALCNDTPPALRSVMLQRKSGGFLRSLKTSFHLPVTLRGPLNSIL